VVLPAGVAVAGQRSAAAGAVKRVRPQPAHRKGSPQRIGGRCRQRKEEVVPCWGNARVLRAMANQAR